MHLALIGPASPSNTYAARLLPELRALGHTVEASLDGIAPDARPVVDALVLPRLSARMDELVARNAVCLVHHPGAHVAYDNGTPGVERELLPRMPRLVASSAPVAARLTEQYGIPPERIRVVEPGLDVLPRSTGSGSDTCALLSVGVLAPRKGFDRLMDALERLPDLRWTLTVAGESGRDPDHEALLESRQTDRIRVVRDPAHLDDLWRAADVFALATRWEGYPTATAEAVRRGLPVVTTDGGGAASPLVPDAGAVCPADDADTLSKTLRRVIYDTRLRREMAEAAWQAGQALPDWATQAACFIAALED